MVLHEVGTQRRVLTIQEYLLTQVLTIQEYLLTQVLTIQEYSITKVLTIHAGVITNPGTYYPSNSYHMAPWGVTGLLTQQRHVICLTKYIRMHIAHHSQ